MEKMQSLKVTTELSREETIVFLTQTRPLGFLSGLGVSIKGKGFLFPQGQCSTIVALMPAVCLVFLRRNLGSLGTSLKWKPPPFKIHMLELAHAWARAQLLLGTFLPFSSLLQTRSLCSALVVSVLSDTVSY